MSNIKLIINADDFGFSQSTNDAILHLISEGKIKSTTVMVNMPFYKEITRTDNQISVGLHLNLTQGQPVCNPLEVPSLVDNDGMFYPFPEFRKRLLYKRINSKDLKLEINSQFDRLINIFESREIDHWDSHQGVHRFPAVIKIASE